MDVQSDGMAWIPGWDANAATRAVVVVVVGLRLRPLSLACCMHNTVLQTKGGGVLGVLGFVIRAVLARVSQPEPPVYQALFSSEK